MELFSNKGYHHVTMQEIAARSEFAIGTLYTFFPNKKELYKAMFLEKHEAYIERITQAISGGENEKKKLRLFLQTKITIFRESLAFIRLFMAESKGASFNIKAGLDRELRKKSFAFLHKLADVFDQGMKRGSFKPIAQPMVLAVALDNMVEIFLLLWLESPEKYNFPENPDEILNIFFQGLIND
jgi:AcrR family transcriptional regulator